jgi:hypothetical protein
MKDEGRKMKDEGRKMKVLYFSYSPHFSVSHIPLGGLGGFPPLSSQFSV